MIDGNVEETLDLRRVEIHAEHAINASSDDEICDELRSDRHATFIFAILSRVAVVGDHRGDSLGACALQAVDEDEQLHQVVVHRLAGAEHDIDVAAAHIFINFHQRFAVRKSHDGGETNRQLKVRADACGEFTA